MIQLYQISKRYQDQVLQNLTATLPTPGLTLLTGPSGSGKTTLAHILLGLREPDQGEVRGTEGLRVSALFQEDRLFPDLTVAENINAVLDKRLSPDEIDALLKRVGLTEVATLTPDALSGGMRRRVAFCRAVAHDGDLIVLDEPFAGLDADAGKLVADEICRLAKTRTVLLILHDPTPFLDVAANLITL